MAVQTGGFRILVWLEATEPAKDAWRRPRFDAAFVYFAGAAAAASLALLASRYAIPPLLNVDSDEFSPELTLSLESFASSAAEPELDPPSPTPASEVYPRVNEIPGFSRCGGETDMGTPSTPRVARYAVQGPKDNPDPHISRWRALGPPHSYYDGLGPFSTDYLSDKALHAPWARDTSLGTDEVSARGNMWGDEMGESDGDDESLGQTHRDGGEVKRIDVERASKPFTLRPARVIHTQVQVQGALPASAIEQALLPSLQNFRECYRSDPASRGDEEGRIDIRIAIEENGQSNEPSALRVQNVAPSTATCILAQIKAHTFAAAATRTDVVYPLLLIPGETGPSPAVARLELAPPIARSNEAVIPCSGSSRRHSNPRGNCER